MSEIVEPGRTGYLVSDVDGAVAAVRQALALDRRIVHEIAASRFGAERMVRDYLVAYERFISHLGGS
jgi:hypothetical protein